MTVLGALPLLDSRNKEDQIKLKWVQDNLTRQVLLKMQQKETTEGPYVIGVVSSLGSEGKSTFVSILSHKLNSMGVKTLSMFPESHAHYITPGNNVTFYSPLQGIEKNVTVDALAEKQVSDFNVVIVEFPPLLEATYPVSLFKQLDLGLYTISASREWQEADKKTLKLVQEITNSPIEVFLNGIQPEESEDINGIQLSTISIQKQKKLQAAKKEENKTGKVVGALKTSV